MLPACRTEGEAFSIPKFDVAPRDVEGLMDELWAEGEWLELPVHEIHARRMGSQPSALEILLNESTEAEWRFRRNLEIRRPLSLIGLHSDIDVPFLSPEIVLLYKAKNRRAQDEADFHNVRNFLDPGRRAWLRQAIEVCHPEHPWLAVL